MNRIIIGGSLLSVLALSFVFNYGNSQRNPAANEMPFELTLTSVAIDPIGKLEQMESAYVRATFNESTVVEFYNKNPLNLPKGQKKVLDAKLEIDPSWIHSDKLEFKLELVNKAAGDHVAIRCAQVSKGLSEYNRTYQCNVPGESSAVLTYRLARKGDPVGGSPVAKN